MRPRLLVINVAGLGRACLGPETPQLDRLAERGAAIAVQPPTPALTSTSQATLLTASLPESHGIVANGWYFRELSLVLNWQRSARLVHGQPLWQAARARLPDLKSANLFWRYATHSSCDLNVIERPTYWANGRKSPDIYTEPAEARDELIRRHGPFPLFRFWGPAAGIESTRWIVDATCDLLERREFDLVLTYLPHLDYDHQRFGPDSPAGLAALQAVDAQAGRLIEVADQQQMRIAVVSDYAFEPVRQPVFLNRALRHAGLLRVQRAENGELLEPGASTAFAVCDQQAAHIYVNDLGQLPRVHEMLSRLEGVEHVFGASEISQLGLQHPRAGELLAIAAAGRWFAYPYWLDDKLAPDFARCVAIHDKPGFDPSELFLSPGLGGKLHLAKRVLQSKLGIRAPFDVIAGDPALVGGSHGRIPERDQQRPILIFDRPVPREADVQPLPMQDVRELLLSVWPS